MAFSQNPFSVASFGESYEQADVTITVTGFAATLSIADVTVTASATVVPTAVEATGSIDDVSVTGTALFSITGVQGTGEVDTNSVVIADALTVITDSFEATVTVDPNSVVTAGATVVPTAVEATGEINDALTITGTALFSIVGVEAEAITDDPAVSGDEVTVDADALVVISDSFEATLSLNGNVTVTGTAVVVPDAVEATGVADDNVTITGTALFDIGGVEGTVQFNGDNVNVIANADVDLTGQSVLGTTTVNTVTVTAGATVISSSVSATSNTNDVTVLTTRFDYAALKELYSRVRTAYIKELTDNTTRTVFVGEIADSVVYIEPQPSKARTVYVAEDESRTVYIEPQSSEYRTVYARAA